MHLNITNGSALSANTTKAVLVEQLQRTSFGNRKNHETKYFKCKRETVMPRFVHFLTIRFIPSILSTYITILCVNYRHIVWFFPFLEPHLREICYRYPSFSSRCSRNKCCGNAACQHIDNDSFYYRGTAGGRPKEAKETK